MLIINRGDHMNLWNERFQHKRYAFGKEPNVFLTEAQNNHHIIEQNDNALAIAEGEGRNAVYLAELGANVTAWDFSIEGLRKAERLALERDVHVETKHVDLNDAQWTFDHWDQIVCIYGHFSPHLKAKTIDGVKKALKPGGHFISEVYSIYQLPYNSGGPKSEDMLYAPIGGKVT
ncbi:class I SAM-dependent methyltransferase [Salicibibacter halophilus]|uniref:Class I SAM-dependent methyltransferase n=2 Tax=Salicibibacter halophilus TaxID=2502791 RepID=A0A514LHR6_9BACI|nr:class I SAM-dependent methyltransferase [Salicibibacter halophilus]